MVIQIHIVRRVHSRRRRRCHCRRERGAPQWRQGESRQEVQGNSLDKTGPRRRRRIGLSGASEVSHGSDRATSVGLQG